MVPIALRRGFFFGLAADLLCSAGTKLLVGRFRPLRLWTCRDWPVSPSEAVAFHRLNAAHCIEIARHISDPGTKASLLVMAQAWLALADHTEKYGEITLVFETLSPPPQPQQVAGPVASEPLQDIHSSLRARTAVNIAEAFRESCDGRTSSNFRP